MKGAAVYIGATAALTILVGWLFTLGFSSPADSAAIRFSALLVIIIQLGAFLAVRRLGARNIMAAVGIGAIIRIFSVIIYAVLVGTVVIVPPAAALLSMATFFFLSSLIEPFVLRL